ncbi:MAG: glycosyltransferase family 39 protein, partial [Polyangiaceae bacterium]
AWEIACPLEGGHWASMAGCAIVAENMLRYHLLAAVVHYPLNPPPTPAQYYCNHPYGIFLMEVVARLLFGHHAWTLRLPALVCSALTPVVLFRLGKELWSSFAAAAATVAFVVVPIDLAFAAFSSLEVPTILFGLVFCLGTVRTWASGGSKGLLLAALGALGACNSDWPGLLLVGAMSCFGLARYVAPRAWHEEGARPAYGKWLVAVAVVMSATVLLYSLQALLAGQLHDVLGASARRSQGYDLLPWRLLSKPYRRMRLEWMVPSVGFAALLAALPIASWRLRREPGQAVLLAWTFTASFQYLYFREGADVHIFWPHYYGPCVALAIGTLADEILSSKLLVGRRGLRPVALAGIVGAPIATMARVGWPMLEQSRMTQGRFDEHEQYIESGALESQFAEWATASAPPDSVIACAGPLCSWNAEYAGRAPQVDGPLDATRRTPSDRDRIQLLDARYTPADDVRKLADDFGATAVGSFLLVDRASSGSGVRAMRVIERQPTFVERLFVTDHDLVRTVTSDVDPWATWQWAEALGAKAPVPQGEPRGLEELAVAYGLAWADGDGPRAEDLHRRAREGLDTTSAAEFTHDVRLLGTTIERGAATVVQLLWETGPGFEPPPESTFVVRCRTVEPPALWPVPVDPYEKAMAPPMTLKPSLWRPRHLYVQRFILLPRPGTDSCRGSFLPREPRPIGGRFDVPLFTVR